MSGRSCTNVANAASFISLLVLALRILSLQSHGASSRFHVSQRGLCIRRVVWIHEHSRASGAGDKLAHESRSRFAVNSPTAKLTPVRLPPGRARLATRPSLVGSSPTTKTMGVVVLAAFAANAAVAPPFVAITATRRRTSSAASTGSRSNSPSRPAVFDLLALDIAGVFQALSKGAQLVRHGVRRSGIEESNHRHRRLLRTRRHRHRHAAAAPPRSDEFPPLRVTAVYAR